MAELDVWNSVNSQEWVNHEALLSTVTEDLLRFGAVVMEDAYTWESSHRPQHTIPAFVLQLWNFLLSSVLTCRVEVIYFRVDVPFSVPLI